MGLLPSKKPDPISERARALNAEIAALEAEIRQLGAQLDSESAAEPTPADDVSPAPSATDTGPSPDTAFEQIDHGRVTLEESHPQDGHYNDLGVRKYDLAGAWRRWQRHFRGPAASNPRLINYLAAGSIQGLRPLRYEARVARNRVLALSLLLLFVLWGLFAVLRG